MLKKFTFLFTLLLCCLGGVNLSAQEVSANYFQDETITAINTTTSGSLLVTFDLDTDCETVNLRVTDPVNAPHERGKPFLTRVRNANGEDIKDLTGRLTVTMRARSAGAVPVQFLFRSGEGTSDFRTVGKTVDIPAGLDEWTEVTVSFDMADFGASFDPTDIRDMWFYLDRTNANWEGNDFYIDHIVIGGAADATQNSPCMLGGGGGGGTETDTMFAAAYFQGDTLVELSQGGDSGNATTFTYDSQCEQLKMEVTDPVNAPLGKFKPYTVRLRDADDNRVTNLTDRLTVSMRVRSAGEVPVEVLFRSEPGSADFRTERKLAGIVPADLDNWTTITATFDTTDFGPGFDPTQIKDFWFYLDRSEENFAGNEFYIDHIVVGGEPDEAQNSPCMLGGGGGTETDTMFAAAYFQGDTLIELSQGGDSGNATTFTYDSECEQLKMEVTDPVNAPLGKFKPYTVRLRDADGNRVTNLTDRLTVSMRVRSAGEVPVEVLFRSEPGTADFRTERKLAGIVPADLNNWTTITASFDAADFGPGFDPTQIKDFWFYLDRSEENFAGNEFYIDHIVVGGEPDEAQNSPCMLGGGGGNEDGGFVEYFQAGDSSALSSINLSNAAARTIDFTVDAECEFITLAVKDEINEPLPRFNAIQVNPVNAAGEDITDLNGNLTVTMRARSAETVNVSVLLRSGGGSMEERTLRKDADIPGGLTEWTEITLTFGPDDLDGYTPGDLRDMWFYLDRGTENFAGNFFAIDHIAVGQAPDPAFNSACTVTAVPETYSVQFDNADNTAVFTGSEVERLTLTTNDCEEVQVAVTDPAGAPLGAFRPLIITPTTAAGTSITDISGLTTVYIRARSAATVPVSILFRSGNGASDFRTAAVTQTVVGDLERYSNLEFTFSEAELGGFDPADLLDMWLYLDRENDNFPGNELYIDYIAIGERPDTADASPCVLPDISVGTNEVAWAQDLRLFPNPTTGLLTIDVPELAGSNDRLTTRVLDLTGREVLSSVALLANGRTEVNLSALPSGIYLLHLRDGARNGVVRRVVKR